VSDLTVWFNPECSKCRTAHGLLAARPPERVLDLLDP
jgi:hypothetical protein